MRDEFCRRDYARAILRPSRGCDSTVLQEGSNEPGCTFLMQYLQCTQLAVSADYYDSSVDMYSMLVGMYTKSTPTSRSAPRPLFLNQANKKRHVF